MSDSNLISNGPNPLQQKSLSNDVKAMMMYEASKRSLPVSYLLWFFLGNFGGHRFYNERNGTAVAQLMLSIFGFLLLFALGLGLLLLIPVWIWLLVDAFLIPGWVNSHNVALVDSLGK